MESSSKGILGLRELTLAEQEPVVGVQNHSKLELNSTVFSVVEPFKTTFPVGSFGPHDISNLKDAPSIFEANPAGYRQVLRKQEKKNRDAYFLQGQEKKTELHQVMSRDSLVQ